MWKADKHIAFFLISKKIILKNTREQRQHKGYREGNKKEKRKEKKRTNNKNTRKSTKANYKEENWGT